LSIILLLFVEVSLRENLLAASIPLIKNTGMVFPILVCFIKIIMSDKIKSEKDDSFIPIIEEELQVEKKTVEKGRVIISKTINEESKILDLPSTNEEVRVERIPINKVIEEMPAAVRYEGNTMIIPVLQEITVVEKKILLVEEIHVTKSTFSSTETKEITLRKEEIKIERRD